LPGQIVRFAAFELDRGLGELRKRGIKIKLQDQPLQILILLVDRPGETITRAEIRDKLWPADTFVDFENAISAGVRKVREALRDNPDSPRFIETVARHGYRFVCPVYKDDVLFVTGSPIEQVPPILISGNRHNGSQIDSQEAVVQSPWNSDLGLRGMMTWAACGIAVLLALFAAFWAGRRSGSPADENLLSNADAARKRNRSNWQN
jgi:DNA-binding winged helix-turn-helix (wHTH) protein